MNNLIIFAHPNPNSFCKGIVDRVVKTSEENSANVKVRDLYKLGFDSILKPSDFEDLQKGKVSEDIREEQENIKWADVITFVYPVWWAAFPAILKGYIDRVFSYGFAYKHEDGQANGLLKGKKVILICTTGSPSEAYAESGMHNSMKQVADAGIFKFCGIEDVRHTFFGAVPYVSDEMRENYLMAASSVVKECLASNKSTV
ncbi:NAD(P)H-dependent oxidoreductase [Clostridium felsineum]|uniref:NAD(P)H-dependent oxidoreductase n=1 Tax=Clostridium felsineum TaxID=36839 RepID=UPI00214D37FE|nr:NAD(P)H-dependent oxidoreductase [Clostridium felsineum]MCR3758859.1 NAD(P)H-dependent oxidoreductase [Clostridium felsineum]